MTPPRTAGITTRLHLRVVWVVLFALCFIPAANAARGPHKEAGTAGASFLTIGSGARYEAQGDAAVADAEGIDAIYWNPAGLAATDKQKVGFTYNNYIADIDLNYFAYVKPTKKNGVYAMSFLYLASGNIDRTEVDNDGNPTTGLGHFTTHDLAFSASYAARFNHRGAWGANVKWIQSKLDREKANAIAFDAGVQFRISDLMSTGFSVQNAGTKIKFRSQKDNLPLNYRAGMAFHIPLFSSARQLRFGADLNIPQYGKIYYTAGTEVTLGRVFMVRLGYNRLHRGFDEWLTGGFGIRFRDMDFDYGYTPHGDLNTSHRFGFGYAF